VANVRTHGLEIDEDFGYQRRAWVVQRVGWVLMVLLVLAAVVGLLGSGPLSHATAHVPQRLSVDYQRFARYETSETLTIRVPPAAMADGVVRLSINRDFLDASKVESVVPAPLRVESAAGRLVFVFAAAEPQAPLEVTLSFQPERIGRRRAVVAVESAGEPRAVTFHQLVYP
jgi:hypothetical protein